MTVQKAAQAANILAVFIWIFAVAATRNIGMVKLSLPSTSSLTVRIWQVCQDPAICIQTKYTLGRCAIFASLFRIRQLDEARFRSNFVDRFPHTMFLLCSPNGHVSIIKGFVAPLLVQCNFSGHHHPEACHHIKIILFGSSIFVFFNWVDACGSQFRYHQFFCTLVSQSLWCSAVAATFRKQFLLLYRCERMLYGHEIEDYSA